MEFWNLIAQIVPVILLALVVEARFTSRAVGSRQDAETNYNNLFMALVAAVLLLLVEMLALIAVLDNWDVGDFWEMIALTGTLFGFAYVALLPLWEFAAAARARNDRRGSED